MKTGKTHFLACMLSVTIAVSMVGVVLSAPANAYSDDCLTDFDQKSWKLLV
ncbi:hypothetical protein [Mobiluncus mulieris]|uniref:hypothetical protein n=1 Tax=Mobiluncus mulieris TaxID=2052 RepID=UPI0020163347|nr:hypothetical protein [Mobiluncus mulieris]